jgi:hypothetical protein
MPQSSYLAKLFTQNTAVALFELFMAHIKALLCERKMFLDKLICATEVATLLSYFKEF